MRKGEPAGNSPHERGELLIHVGEPVVHIFPRAHRNLGLALFKQEDVERAIAHLSEAIRLKPDYAEAHNSLGFALHQQGRIREAIVHYSEALRLDPNLTVARQNLRAAQAGQ